MASFMDKYLDDKIIVIDSLNLAFRFKKNKSFASKYLRTIRSFAQSYKCNRVVLVGDWGSYWRKDLYPEYKANRDEMRARETEEEKEEFRLFLDEYNKALDFCREEFLVLKYKGVEGDDIAAYIASNWRDKFNRVWLISSDNDWKLMLQPRVSIFNQLKNQEITTENFKELFGYDWHLFLGVKALQGDKSDNIFGVSGIGEKRAISLMESYGTIYDLIESIPIPNPRKYKHIDNLNASREALERNLQLMDCVAYCEEAIGAENCESIDKLVGKLADNPNNF